ncbi:hypothetical protein MN1_070 [Thermus phage MN1]|nr:hypothetical protein MN1_070 [Thermus phage MN1]
MDLDPQVLVEELKAALLREAQLRFDLALERASRRQEPKGEEATSVDKAGEVN